jgi:hypothetical protein
MTVEQQLAELQERVRKLEGHQDQLGPNAFSLDPNGKVFETLTGYLQAAGIVLAIGKTPPGPHEAIQWFLSLPPAGDPSAFISVTSIGDLPIMELAAQESDEAKAALVVEAGPFGRRIFATADELQELLLDDQQHSHWLQLNGPSTLLQLTHGAGTFNWAGERTANATVTHSLGRTPVFAIATLTGGGTIFGNAQYVGNSANETEIAFSFEAVNEPEEFTGYTGTSTFQWIAIG